MTNHLERLFDRVGCRLVSALLEDGRLSFHELGRRVNLSAPATAERVRRLEQAGVILGYRAEVDPKKVGYDVLAFVAIETTIERAADVARDMPEVLECHRVTGRHSFILKVVAESVSALEDVLDRLLPFGALTTSIVLSSPVAPRSIGCIPSRTTAEMAPARS
jgi:Lrp/AsnC family leucine-responsive transcriptional regulator